MKIMFEYKAFEEFNEWASVDKKIYDKIVALIRDIKRNPYSGKGKAEPLKYSFTGCWSRRITEEHRLVYKIIDDEMIIMSCKYHYKEH